MWLQLNYVVLHFLICKLEIIIVLCWIIIRLRLENKYKTQSPVKPQYISVIIVMKNDLTCDNQIKLFEISETQWDISLNTC